MRTFTDAQKRELTSPGTYKLLFDSTGGSMYYKSTFINNTTYSKYAPILQIDSFMERVDFLGGMASIADVKIMLNNARRESNNLSSSYYENEEASIKLIINDSVHTVFQGVVGDYAIDEEVWEINLIDETTKFDVDILTEITRDNYADAPEEAIGMFLPLLYCDSYVSGVYNISYHSSGGYLASEGDAFFIPAINLNENSFKLFFANHDVESTWDNASTVVGQYNNEIDWYIHWVIIGTATWTEASGGSYVEFYGANGAIYDYRKAIDVNVKTITDAVKDMLDSDLTNSTQLLGGEFFCIHFSIPNLGTITSNDNLYFIIENDNRTGTPEARMYKINNTTDYYDDVIDADTFTYTPIDDTNQNWSVDEISNYYLKIIAEASEAIDVKYVTLNVTFNLYNRRMKRTKVITRDESARDGRVIIR